MQQSKLDNCAFFLGLTSIPFSEINKLYENNILPIFDNLKKCQLSYTTKVERGQYYIPRPFYIFGEFDLAVLALTDNNDIIRSFIPFNSTITEPLPFKHQIYLGSPIIRGTEGSTVNEFEEIFSNANQPLISITHCKISNFLVISEHCKILDAIKIFVDELFASDNDNLKCLTFFSNSWDDLIIITFSNSYSSVTNKLTQLRDVNVGDLFKDDTEEFFSEIQHNFNKINFSKHSFVFHPVFKNTLTSFGFDYNIFKEEKNADQLIELIKDDEDLNYTVNLLVKGGYLNDVHYSLLNDLQKSFNKYSINVVPGNYDLSIQINNGGESVLLKSIIEFLKILSYDSNYTNKIYGVNTLINFPESTLTGEIKKKPLDYFRELSNYRSRMSLGLSLHSEKIRTIEKELKIAGISEVLTSGLNNVLGEYNCGIQDTMCYSNFIELEYFVKDFIDFLEKCIKDGESIKNLNMLIEDFLHVFNYAFSDRIHNGFSTTEITDNNIFLKGGIQKSATIYSGFNNLLCDILNIFHGAIHLKGLSEVSSSSTGIRFNFQYLWQPGLLIHTILVEGIQSKIRTDRNSSIYRIFNSRFLDAESNIKEGIVQKAINIITNDHKFNDSDEEMFVNILQHFSPIFFDHLASDFITLKLLYLDDIELYINYQLGYFYSSSRNYDTKLVINKDSMIIQLLRLLFVMRLSGHKASENMELILNYSEKNHKMMNDWYFKVREIVYILPMEDELYDYATQLKYLFYEVLGSVNKRYKHENPFEKYVEYVESIADSMGKEFKDNPINLSFKWGGGDIFEGFIAATLNYLRFIDINWMNKKYKLLDNNWSTNKIIAEMEQFQQALLFDPRGGVFAFDFDVRDKLLYLRNHVQLIFWSLSNEFKRNRIVELFQHD